MMVAGFMRLVAAWGSLGSFELVWFVRARHGGRSVLSGSSGSSGCALGVACSFRSRVVRPGAPWVSLESFTFF